MCILCRNSYEDREYEVNLQHAFAIKRLDLRCQRVTSDDIPNFLLDRIEVLTVQNCVRFDRIPVMKNLLELNCNGTKVKEITNLPRVYKIRASNCVNLFRLKELPCLRDLQCVGCPRLKKLVRLPVEVVDCSDCKSLTYIELEQLYELKCRNCPIAIPIKFSKLAYLDCGNTPVESIDASDCPEIVSLIVDSTIIVQIRKFPKLTSLICDNCLELALIADLKELSMLSCRSTPKLKTVSRTKKLHFANIMIEKEKLSVLNQCVRRSELGLF